MSDKVRDRHGRWRSIDVNFRVSPEENKLINQMVALSGLTKREYLVRRAMAQDVVVMGNPRVYKAMKKQMEQLYLEFSRLCHAGELAPETQELLRFAAAIYDKMNEKG
jgi:uncharacterized protein (DUF1778 family)